MMIPGDFLWGAATAANAVEGATHEDGRGESIWDRFATTPGKIADGSAPQPGADHYHRWPDDVTLMRDLGLRAYRFSIAWPRVQPEGRGRPNRPGLDFYERLVESLLDAGICPFVTLYHWDLPQAVQERGGWADPDTARRFADVADVVSYRLGDRVHDWITVNEPQTVAWRGHVTGEHAPGQTRPDLYAPVAHQLLRAHGLAAPVIRGNGRGACRIGIALNLSLVEPASDRDDDARAATLRDGTLNRWYLDAVFKGAYPADIVERQPVEVDAGEMAAIAAPLDFLDVVYGGREVVVLGPDEEPRVTARHNAAPSAATEEGAPGLYDVLARVAADYSPPRVYVTAGSAECDEGRAFPETGAGEPCAAALEAQLDQVGRAVEAGLPVGGYFVWPLLDSWEWDLGYTVRRGLIGVNRATQARTIKGSGRRYAAAIAGIGS